MRAPSLPSSLKALIIWIALLAALMYAAAILTKRPPPPTISAQSGHDGKPHARLDALGYLNLLRREAGLDPFARPDALTRSAANHARYLNDYPEDMHDENHADSPLYTGKELDERVEKTGYLYLGVQENLSTGAHAAPMGEQALQHQYIDGLMTAIYHRFSLLDPVADEAGIAYSTHNNRHALVINQGRRDAERLCRLNRSEEEVDESRSYYSGLCRNGAVFYQDELKLNIPDYTVYPVGKLAAPVFSNETPNPLPDREYSGNPVSIAFAEGGEEPQMISFELFKGKEKIGNTRLLTAETDPNKRLSPYQFALFPLDPLAYDTAYRAVFRYRLPDWENDGDIKEHTAEWSFRTRKPDYPYFNLKGGENLAVESGRSYYLRWPAQTCRPDCSRISFREYGGAEIATYTGEYDGLIVSVSGKRGSGVRVKPLYGNTGETALLVQ